MGLKIIIGRDGKPCSMWYGVFQKDGRRNRINLGVPLVGKIPTNTAGYPILTAEGDEAFERSRRAAEKAFARVMRENRKSREDLAEQVLEKRTGQKAEGVALDDMGETWIKAQPKRSNDKWRNAERKWFDTFARCARREAKRLGKPCDGVKDITPEIVEAWIEHIKGAYSYETLKRQILLMGSAFDLCVGNRRGKGKNAADVFEVVENPFIIKGKQALDVPEDGKGVSRVPLTEAQLARLFDLTQNDPKIYPLVVCAACTGLRIGDVCALTWDSIDLDAGLITLTTAKTRKRVTLPMFARLREVIEDLKPIEAAGNVTPSPYVFPTAHTWYERNPDGLYRYAKPYFARAVFGDNPAEVVEVTDERTDGEADGAAKLSAVRDIEEALAEATFTDEKKNKILEIYRRFKSGVRSADIATALGLKRSQVSMYLADAERLTGERLRPVASGKPTKLDLARKTRQGRDIGKHAASLYGWHSLRATFVVLAGEAGVPLADVQIIVGHTTMKTTSKHYYNPTERHTAERVKRQLQSVGTILDTRLDGHTDAQALPLPPPSASNTDALEALIANMSEAEREAFARRLLGR